MTRFFSSAALAALLVAPLGPACVFMDDDDTAHVRGYTDCGTFLGGATCSPGQYCSDPGFSECSNGCLSDVNCASNQACFKGTGQQVGVCENVTSSVVGRTLSFDADAGVGADAVGGDASR